MKLAVCQKSQLKKFTFIKSYLSQKQWRLRTFQDSECSEMPTTKVSMKLSKWNQLSNFLKNPQFLIIQKLKRQVRRHRILRLSMDLIKMFNLYQDFLFSSIILMINLFLYSKMLLELSQFLIGSLFKLMNTMKCITKLQNLLENSVESITTNGQIVMQSEASNHLYQSKHTIFTTLMQLETFQNQTLTEAQMKLTLKLDQDSPSWAVGKLLGIKVTHFLQSTIFLRMSRIQTSLFWQQDFHINSKELLLRISHLKSFFLKVLQTLESIFHCRWSQQHETCTDT